MHSVLAGVDSGFACVLYLSGFINICSPHHQLCLPLGSLLSPLWVEALTGGLPISRGVEVSGLYSLRFVRRGLPAWDALGGSEHFRDVLFVTVLVSAKIESRGVLACVVWCGVRPKKKRKEKVKITQQNHPKGALWD